MTDSTFYRNYLIQAIYGDYLSEEEHPELKAVRDDCWQAAINQVSQWSDKDCAEAYRYR